MPFKWSLPQSPLTPAAPQVVLAAPGSLGPGSRSAPRLLSALAAGSLLAVGTKAPAISYIVINLNNSGTGSLRDAVQQANTNPGPDVITFHSGLSGTIRSSVKSTSPTRCRSSAPAPAR